MTQTTIKTAGPHSLMKKIVTLLAPSIISLLAFIFPLSFAIFLLSFALKNTNIVDLHYYLGFIWHAPLYLIVLSSLFSGLFIGLLSSLIPVIKLRRHNKKLQGQLNTAELKIIKLAAQHD